MTTAFLALLLLADVPWIPLNSAPNLDIPFPGQFTNAPANSRPMAFRRGSFAPTPVPPLPIRPLLSITSYSNGVHLSWSLPAQTVVQTEVCIALNGTTNLVYLAETWRLMPSYNESSGHLTFSWTDTNAIFGSVYSVRVAGCSGPWGSWSNRVGF